MLESYLKHFLNIRKGNIPGPRSPSEVNLEHSRESLNGNLHSLNELDTLKDDSTNKGLNSFNACKDKHIVNNGKLTDYTASYLNAERSFDATSFKRNISYDIAEKFPVLSELEKESPALFSKPLKEATFVEDLISITSSKETYEKVCVFFM